MGIMRITAVVSALLLIILTAVLHLAPQTVDVLDASVSRMIMPLQTFTGIQFFLAVTVLGGGVGIMLVSIGLVYIARLAPAQVLRLIFLLVSVAVATRILKELVARSRPDPLAWFDTLPAFSFPSAHASAAFALYGFIAVLIYRRTRRISYVLIPSLAILLVGLSRIVLNAHHFSDVIGGYLLGALVLSVACIMPFEKLINRYG